MKKMPETTFRERLPDFRNRYGRLKSKTAKGNFLTRLCKTFGFERKYLTKLLNGVRRYRPAHGRAPTYGPEVERADVRIRRAIHSTYFAVGLRFIHRIRQGGDIAPC